MFLQAIVPLTILPTNKGQPTGSFPLGNKERLPAHISTLASMAKQRTWQQMSIEYIE